jgi:hypothetical protein
MSKFKVLRLVIKGNIEKSVKAFESEVQLHLDSGWTIINCERDTHAFYAFLQSN